MPTAREGARVSSIRAGRRASADVSRRRRRGERTAPAGAVKAGGAAGRPVAAERSAAAFTVRLPCVSLTSLELDLLVAIDRLTRDSYLPADQDDVFAELGRMGVQQPPNAMWLYYAAQQLREDGYVQADFAGGMTIVNVKLTREGREAARAVADPMAKVLAESRVKIGSKAFAAAFPGAYEPWADAAKLLYGENAAAELTTIGHKVREASQAFATAAIAKFGADNPPEEPSLVKRRLGAVIAHNRDYLSQTKREVLEDLGDLWETAVDLIQRQEHAAQKEGEPISFEDGRRVVNLTMFLMLEFATILADRTMPHQRRDCRGAG